MALRCGTERQCLRTATRPARDARPVARSKRDRSLHPRRSHHRRLTYRRESRRMLSLPVRQRRCSIRLRHRPVRRELLRAHHGQSHPSIRGGGLFRPPRRRQTTGPAGRRRSPRTFRDRPAACRPPGCRRPRRPLRGWGDGTRFRVRGSDSAAAQASLFLPRALRPSSQRCGRRRRCRYARRCRGRR
ncbi:Uncharacterised protein [Mycobacteroides abscessus subsp. abscessus]|nr:Uncharacterised protein [Mycobacteroides abscessus subsp. abscessus]